jgi:Fe2+ transport protein
MDERKLSSSKEADTRGLALGRAEGEAYGRILTHMLDDVAEGGAEKCVGDYLIAYAVEKAEGMYAPKAGQLVWETPGQDNIHIEIVVRDRADGRLIPGLDVSLTVEDAEGETIGTHQMPFLWHPYLHHYGRNWSFPGDGEYTLRVFFPTPQFRRHDKENGMRFAEGAETTFERVKIKTGRE